MTTTTPYLTPVQAKVLTETANGGKLREIAERLDMPRLQVSARLSEGYKNLGLGHLPRSEKRAEAISLARRHGLIG